MDYQGRTVVITGGTGGLGTAVVDALIAAGATCHVPYRGETAAQVFRHHGHKQVTLHAQIDLTDEDAVGRLYRQIPNLWASIHLTGGFAPGRIAAAGKSVLASQLDVNLMTCYLCCRSAVMAMATNSAGGRIVNVAAPAAFECRGGARLEAPARQQ